MTDIYTNSVFSLGLERIYIPKSVEFIGKSNTMPADIYYGGSKEDYMKITSGYWDSLYYQTTDNSKKTIHYNVKTFSNNKLCDPDGNGTVNSSDASLILSYYAYVSTGGTKSFAEVVKPYQKR